MMSEVEAVEDINDEAPIEIRNTMATALIGSVESLDINSDNWLEYVERVEQYFIANEITTEVKKKGILLTIIGSEAYTLLRSLTEPEKPSEKTYQQIVDILKRHLNPKPITIAERWKFYQRSQNNGEALKDYIAELRRLSRYCEFGGFLDEAIRDKFVCGLLNSSIRKRLLTEENLNLERATNLALSLEASKHENKLMDNNEGVNKVNFDKRRCYRCSDDTHLADSCRYKTFICRNCNLKGHLARACRRKKGNVINSEINTTKQSPYTKSRRDGNDEGSHSGHNDENNLYTGEDEVTWVKMLRGTNPYKILLPVNGNEIEFEIDTGSGKTIFSEKVYREKLNEIPLEKSNLTLRTYLGEKLPVLGKLRVKIEYNKQNVTEYVHVVQGHGPTLLGRDILSRIDLNWSAVYRIESRQNMENGVPHDFIEKLSINYQPLFTNKTGHVPGEIFKAKFHVVKDATPIFRKSRKVPFALEEAVSRELKRLEDEGIIQSIPYSDWASPIVIVPKADGQIRITGDFKRTINPSIHTEQYPLPNPEELFQKMQGGKLFTKLDLKEAYLQIELHEECKKYFVINTPDGLKQNNRMVYGGPSGPAIFQRFLSGQLKDVEMIAVNQDDVLISGRNTTHHIKNLKEVLDKFRELGITLNLKKCKFFQTKVEYVGFIISKDGVSTNPEKIKPILEAPDPKNITELRSFLGAINYYGNFITDMAVLTAPLNMLLGKGVEWKWSEDEKEAFEVLKRKLAETPVLCLYDKNLPLKLSCDASSYGIGAILSHVFPDKTERPIAFASRSLNKSEKNYSQLDKEALAIIFALQKFRQYVYGRKFTLCTDNKALAYIFDREAEIPTLAASRIARWAVKLSEYDYDVQFKTTKQHANVDMLSRLPLETTIEEQSINALNIVQINCLPITAQQIQEETIKDVILKKVISYVQSGRWPLKKIDNDILPYYNKRNELSVQKGVIMWGLKVIIPYKYRKDIIDELHKQHPGITRMKTLSRIHVWYPQIDKDIENCVKSCYECNKSKGKPVKAFVHPWTWPAKPFDRVHVDFFTLYGRNYLLLVDSHSKWLEVEQMSSTKTYHTIQTLRRWFVRFGVPIQLVSDNGPQFVAAEFEQFLNENGVKHIKCSAYHPSSNGGAERFVQTVKKGLRACHIENGVSARKHDNFLFSYRTTPSSVTGKTPSELLLNRQIRSRLDLLRPNMDTPHKDTSLNERMRKYNEKMQKRVQGRGPVRILQEGDKVFVRNHVGKNRWFTGYIVSKVADRTYIVKIGVREVKRHIDDIRLAEAGVRDNIFEDNENSDNDSWMQDTTRMEVNVPESRPIPGTRRHRRYPRRARRPVDRYGISTCV